MAEKKASIRLQPLADIVIVEPAAADEKSPHGIILPDMAKQKSQQGTVLAVGPGRRKDDGVYTPCTVRVGDTVLFGKYSGSDIEHDGREVKILHEGEILAVISTP